MSRHLIVALTTVALVSGYSLAQAPPPSDPQAVVYAQQSVAALAGSASISDVTLNAYVTSTGGGVNDTGKGMFRAKGTNESRVDLSLSAGTRSDVRNLNNYGLPAGAWQQNSGPVSAFAQHNCWTDAAWFFPAYSALTQTANPTFVYRYIGTEQYNGASVQHIQVSQFSSRDPNLTRLSTMDFYLDSVSFLPLDVKFFIHADNDLNTNIQAEVRFSTYQVVSGIQIPFYFQRLINGNLDLDVTVTSAVVNSDLSDSIFKLQ